MTSWTSPTQYARILAKYGVPLHPKTAFMEALVENDFGDGPNFAAWEASDTPKSYPEWMTDRVMHYSPDSLSYKLRRFLYDQQRAGAPRVRPRPVRLAGRRSSDGGRAGRARHRRRPGPLPRPARACPAPGDAPDPGEIALFRTALEYSQETAARNGIRLVVFIVPTKEMVYQDRFPDPALRAADGLALSMRCCELLAETGIEHVDLLPPLRAAAAQRQAALLRARHPLERARATTWRRARSQAHGRKSRG